MATSKSGRSGRNSSTSRGGTKRSNVPPLQKGKNRRTGSNGESLARESQRRGWYNAAAVKARKAPGGGTTEGFMANMKKRGYNASTGQATKSRTASTPKPKYGGSTNRSTVKRKGK